ncbi:Uncharacterised protein [Acholeplasma oculi]|uniref:Uncharacterized protein n=1 Tax=Acholeplasma oculi TaxID=35623 RepID=A0A061AHF7_9MOLU|nr:hypothetical protein Aocu_09780 [Acholeplasma oculi]SUT90624.1 Uncharacterised protein [Acholeplasma oculi]
MKEIIFMTWMLIIVITMISIVSLITVSFTITKLLDELNL